MYIGLSIVIHYRLSEYRLNSIDIGASLQRNMLMECLDISGIFLKHNMNTIMVFGHNQVPYGENQNQPYGEMQLFSLQQT